MDKKDFQNQVITTLGKVLEKLEEHGKRFETIENKLNTIAKQTAKNAIKN